MTPSASVPMYQIIVSYPLEDWPKPDDQIHALAYKYGGAELGSGAGMSQRDLVFEFKRLDRLTTQFLIDVLKLPEVEVTIFATLSTPLLVFS